MQVWSKSLWHAQIPLHALIRLEMRRFAACCDTQEGQIFKEKLRLKIRDDRANLTGPLVHLRSWANNRLRVPEQNA